MSLLSGHQVVVVDTETTGLSPAEGHALVEVATVVVADDGIGESWSSLVQPGRPIPPDAAAVHGITEAMVAEAPPPAPVAAELRRRCGDATLAFHNAMFDLPFLVALLRQAGEKPLYNPVVDTLGLARGLGEPGGNSLGALATRFGFTPEARHRALADARMTARVLVTLSGRWERERGVRSLDELAAVSQDMMRLSTAR